MAGGFRFIANNNGYNRSGCVPHIITKITLLNNIDSVTRWWVLALGPCRMCMWRMQEENEQKKKKEQNFVCLLAMSFCWNGRYTPMCWSNVKNFFSYGLPPNVINIDLGWWAYFSSIEWRGWGLESDRCSYLKNKIRITRRVVLFWQLSTA